jgi:hypothetical protein
MNQEYLNKKAMHMSDEQIYSCIAVSLLQALKMLATTAKPGQERYVFDGIIDIIRNRFNDFTMNQIDTAIKSGSYGEYGDYSKLNPKTIMDWLNKKRLEVSAHNEKFSKEEKRVHENQVIPCKNGGSAVLLGLFYNRNGYEMSFQDRLKLIESRKNCPFTGKSIDEIIRTFKIDFKLERR